MHPCISSCIQEWWCRCGRQSFYFGALEGKAERRAPSLLTSTGNRAIRRVPIPPRPLKRLQMYSAPICHSWECGGVSSYVPTLRWWRRATTTRSFSPASGHPTPLLQFYTFGVMDNDVVALFSLLWRPRSCINCSFTCISFMHRPAPRRSVVCAGELDAAEFSEQNSLLNQGPFLRAFWRKC